MILTRLRLERWRGYDSLDLRFPKGLNLILGPNGSGKTNLAEAIAYLSLARSWRTSEDRYLIQQGQEEASLFAEILDGAIPHAVGISLSRRGKRILIDGKPCRKISELSSLANVLVFSPDDVALFQGPPAERRACIDVALSKKSSEYFSLISAYSKILRERNLALKDPHPDLELIKVYASQMATLEAPIVARRRRYVDSLNSVLPSLMSRLRGEETPCELVYLPFVKEGGDIEKRAEEAHFEALEGELIRRTTAVGVHREDFRFLHQGKDVALYGSQGENRLSALCLKLAPYFLIEEEAKKPVVVLDDVTSELDEEKQKNLLLLCREFGQAFLTATNLEAESASVTDVASHIATRRN